MRRLLVLWDVDHTLVDSGGIGQELYEAAFREMFGREMPQPSSMAGRTDRAIAAEVLALAGETDPGLIDSFHALMAARAPALAEAARQRTRALPGAGAALAALAALADPAGLANPVGPANPANPANPVGLANPASLASPANGERSGPGVVQSLLTGNLRPLAEVKLGPFDLIRHLDLDAGAYGDAHEERAELVPLARRNAARSYGPGLDGSATVLVGDTPLDVAAALATGARAVGVATGRFTAQQLAAAGAHAVLPDLADTGRVLAAILGPDRTHP